jgi:hypothetical protein
MVLVVAGEDEVVLNDARTKRWWLFDAESIRWPMISRGDHFPGRGRRR